MNEPILVMEDICKGFPGVTALSHVNFQLLPGEVHALMGQNGAGKSTLIKVLTGFYKYDSGGIRLDGRPIHPASPLEAQKMGISTVYQEVNLCPNLSVAENIFIGREPRRRGRIDWKTMNRRAGELLKKLNLKIAVTRLLSSYSVAIQQMVAIARALNISAKILILDEPTSSLAENEVQLLFKVINRLKKEGMAILFVTHFIDQMYRITDRVTVLKNGECVGNYKTGELSKLELIAKMLGKELTEFSRENVRGQKKSRIASGRIPTEIKTRGLEKKGSIAPFDLDIRGGEILGLAGLLGSGRTEIAKLLFGIEKADNGEVLVDNHSVSFNSPYDAINFGLGLCPEDRKEEGIIGELSVRENIILALQAKKNILGFVNRKKQEETAASAPSEAWRFLPGESPGWE